jgi:hypothetical protein
MQPHDRLLTVNAHIHCARLQQNNVAPIGIYQHPVEKGARRNVESA